MDRYPYAKDIELGKRVYTPDHQFVFRVKDKKLEGEYVLFYTDVLDWPIKIHRMEKLRIVDEDEPVPFSVRQSE